MCAAVRQPTVQERRRRRGISPDALSLRADNPSREGWRQFRDKAPQHPRFKPERHPTAGSGDDVLSQFPAWDTHHDRGQGRALPVDREKFRDNARRERGRRLVAMALGRGVREALARPWVSGAVACDDP